MAAAPQSPNADAPKSGIPAELLDQLHEANERFKHAREHVEQANAALVNPFDQRQAASDDVRDAERGVEEAEQKIKKALDQPPA